MVEVSFNLFNNFKCLANDCKHSCCIGWQIDLDKQFINRLNKLKRAHPCLADKLTNGVDCKNGVMVMSNGRCPFLNGENLCDIIITAGEKSIPKTCKLHPRFINEIAGRKETGFGLSCQMALSLLFNFNGKFGEVIKEDKNQENTKVKNKGLDGVILEKRKEVITAIQREDIPLFSRLGNIAKENCLTVNGKDILAFAKFLLTLEILDKKWTEILTDFINNFNQENFTFNSVNLTKKQSLIIENLFCYFIYRHLSNSREIYNATDIRLRCDYAVISTYFLVALSLDGNGNLSNEKFMENVRNYSAETEYSFENFYGILDYIEELEIRKKFFPK